MATERVSRESDPVPRKGHSPRKRPLKAKFKTAARRLPRAVLWALVGLVILVMLIVIASFFVDEPMRRSIEKNMNQRLTGYTVQLPRLHFQLIGLSVTLYDLKITQQAHPDPPVAFIPRLHASVQWKEILSGHIVSDFLFDQPRIQINLPQLRKEVSDETPVKDRGWQQAAEAIYPFKINLLRVNDADFVYVDEDPKRPLHISHLSFRANNIRNIHSKDRVYPSPVHAEGAVFETGRAIVDGHADFLARPYAGIHIQYRLEKIPLDNLRPITARSNLVLKGGLLASDGEVEYAPKWKFVKVRDLTINGLHLDYIHTARTAAAESARKEKVKQAARKATNEPGVVLRLDRFDLVDSNIGLVNKTKKPDFRLFVSGANLHVTNLSNRTARGPAVARLRGKFMGSGPSVAVAHFRPEGKTADFDLDLAIENTSLPDMNDLLRAYGKIDVTEGKFSLYSQIRVKDRYLTGYVKPFFEGMKVYDREQDREKSFFHKLYEGIVGGLAKLLENRKTNEVATRVDVSGPVGGANANVWDVIGGVLENAFVKAILPGFDREVVLSKKKR